MKRGILLTAGWVVLVVLAHPRSGRGDPPPDCQDCDCHDAKAWQYTSYDENGVPTSGNPSVLKVYDSVKDKFGDAVTSASTNQFNKVYAPSCLKNNKQEDTTNTFKYVIYTENWDPTCTLKGSQTKSNNRPVAFDANSTKFSPYEGTSKRYTCGPQSE